ncbi:MAG: hypothetical protein V3V96_17450 [Acidiferrobacterales bacterium]
MMILQREIIGWQTEFKCAEQRVQALETQISRQTSAMCATEQRIRELEAEIDGDT